MGHGAYVPNRATVVRLYYGSAAAVDEPGHDVGGSMVTDVYIQNVALNATTSIVRGGRDAIEASCRDVRR